MNTLQTLAAEALTTLLLATPLACQSTEPLPQSATIGPCKVIDGDTLRCGEERIRLLGIDAPELPGHCRNGRNCAPGDPVASSHNLQKALNARMTIWRMGTDRYGRTLALIESGGRDLACHQLMGDHAIYRAEWDNGHHIARLCPEAAQ